MAFDAALADRARAVLRDQPGFSEKRMFGGLCFLINGNMAGGILGSDLMVRMDKADYAEALKLPHCRAVEMTGRPMTGILLVAPRATADDAGLRLWLGKGVDLAGSLPAK